jgi:hypothetical protein
LFAQVLLCYAYDFVVICSFTWCHYSCSSCFRLVFPLLLLFCRCGGIVQIQIFKPDFESDFFFPTFVCWWIFLMIHVFRKWSLIMCLFVVCKNYLDIVHLIMHIASHFYTIHFICTIALCIFLTHCIFF